MVNLSQERQKVSSSRKACYKARRPCASSILCLWTQSLCLKLCTQVRLMSISKADFFPVAQQPPVGPQPPVGQGLLIIEAPWSYSDTPRSVGLLWTSDQSYAETSTDKTQHSQETDIHAPSEIRTHNSCKRTAADPLWPVIKHSLMKKVRLEKGAEF
jgi:hypothetical protein